MDKLNMTYKEKRKYIADLERDYAEKESIFKKECNFIKNNKHDFNYCDKLEFEYLEAKQLLSNVYSDENMNRCPTWQEGKEYINDLKNEYLDLQKRRIEICKNDDVRSVIDCFCIMIKEDEAHFRYGEEYIRIKIEQTNDAIKAMKLHFAKNRNKKE